MIIIKPQMENNNTPHTVPTVPSDLQSGGAEGAHLQCAVDCKSTYSMPADYKSTGTLVCRVFSFSHADLANLADARRFARAPSGMYTFGGNADSCEPFAMQPSARFARSA